MIKIVHLMHSWILFMMLNWHSLLMRNYLRRNSKKVRMSIFQAIILLGQLWYLGMIYWRLSWELHLLNRRNNRNNRKIRLLARKIRIKWRKLKHELIVFMYIIIILLKISNSNKIGNVKRYHHFNYSITAYYANIT